MKLNFGRLEDLQQKSKVFREVFAMTDLHHPNIVRYSTCWVEIEAPKETEITKKTKKEIESIFKSQDIVEEIVEESQSKTESSVQGHKFSNTSSMAFEWDVGNEESQSKSPKITEIKRGLNKKHSHTEKVKSESSFVLKSLSKV